MAATAAAYHSVYASLSVVLIQIHGIHQEHSAYVSCVMTVCDVLYIVLSGLLMRHAKTARVSAAYALTHDVFYLYDPQ